MKKWMAVALAGLLAAGCDDGTGISGARVAVDFSTTPTTAASIMGFGTPIAASIDVPGSNGVLTLDTVHVILNEFELERVEDLAGCDSAETDDHDACEEFEVGPALLELPLDGGTTTAVSADVQPGEYGQLEFEIEDLEDDEDDPSEAEAIADLRDDILARFDDWPREASMRLVGTFTPTEGDPISFRAYAEAEIEVELEFDTPFVVTEEDVSRVVTVELDPSSLFKRPDGSVLNLAEYDYPSSGRVLAFEFEMENGFEGVDHDDD